MCDSPHSISMSFGLMKVPIQIEFETAVPTNPISGMSHTNNISEGCRAFCRSAVKRRKEIWGWRRRAAKTANFFISYGLYVSKITFLNDCKS